MTQYKADVNLKVFSLLFYSKPLRILSPLDLYMYVHTFYKLCIMWYCPIKLWLKGWQVHMYMQQTTFFGSIYYLMICCI